MLDTALTRMFNLSTPIIQAGMGGDAGPDLASAVSNAGAMGGMGSIGVSPRGVREIIARCRDLTQRPWTLNVLTFDWAPFAQELVDVAIDERVPAVVLSFGDSGPAIRKVKAAGIPVLAQVQDLESARTALEAGADVVIAQGQEAGGHTGQRSTLAFGAQVLDMAGATPVVLAGGVGNGRGLAAALAMGAAGVVMGTRFKATLESTGAATQKEAIIRSDGSNTMAAEVFDAPYPINWPEGIVGRAMRSKFSDEWSGREAELRAKAASMPPFALVGQLAQDPATEINFAGESAGLVDEVLPAAEVVARTTAQALELLTAVAERLSVSASSRSS